MLEQGLNKKPCSNKNNAPSCSLCEFFILSAHIVHCRQGEYVVLASEPLCICGVDVAAPQQHRGGAHRALQDVFTDLEAQLTDFEVSSLKLLMLPFFQIDFEGSRRFLQA